jgi:hypothetical protein
MTALLKRKFDKLRRRRALSRVRRRFAEYGYFLDAVDDSKLEAALTRGGADRLDDAALSAKTIFLAAQRLSAGAEGKVRRSA